MGRGKWPRRAVSSRAAKTKKGGLIAQAAPPLVRSVQGDQNS